MASKYWLKLFHETIYDPKIMMRSPGARLRWYECLCLAGDYDKDGELPPIEHMLYVFRIPEDQLIKELEELVSPGLLTYRDGVYSITNWHDRQSAMDTNERSMRYRETQQKREYYETDTKVKRERNDSATVRDADIDKDIDKEKTKNNAQPTDNIAFVGEFLEKSGLKSLASNDQGYEIIEFRDTYGADKVMSAALWIKDKKITNIKKALSSLRTALPTWTTAIPKESAPKRMYKDPDGNVVMI